MTNDELLQEISKSMLLHLQPVCDRLDHIDTRLGSLENRMGALEKRMDALEKRVDVLDERVGALEKRMDVLEKRMDILEKRLDAVEKRMGKVEIQIESEFMPLLREVGSYGRSVYKRYLDSTEQIDVLEKNQQVLMRIVAEHSREIQRLS